MNTIARRTGSIIGLAALSQIVALICMSALLVGLTPLGADAQRVPSQGQTMMRKAPITRTPLSPTERLVVEVRKAAREDGLRNLSQLGSGSQWPANSLVQRPPKALELPGVPAVLRQGIGRPPTGLELPGIQRVPRTGMGRPPTGLQLPGIQRVPRTGMGRPPTGLQLPGIQRVPRSGTGKPATR